VLSDAAVTPTVATVAVPVLVEPSRWHSSRRTRLRLVVEVSELSDAAVTPTAATVAVPVIVFVLVLVLVLAHCCLLLVVSALLGYQSAVRMRTQA